MGVEFFLQRGWPHLIYLVSQHKLTCSSFSTIIRVTLLIKHDLYRWGVEGLFHGVDPGVWLDVSATMEQGLGAYKLLKIKPRKCIHRPPSLSLSHEDDM